MSSILAPTSDASYREGVNDWYGAVELDAETKDEVWKFDATESDLGAGRYEEDCGTVKFKGFRPSSVQRLDNGLTLISGWRRIVLVDEDGDVVKTIEDSLMNDVHETKKTERGTYLAACTGFDTIIEIDEEGNRLWEWNMWEHTFNTTFPDKYYPDEIDRESCTDVAFHPDQRYHLNYVTELNEEELLASALNYGIFLIDRETGQITQKQTGLEECHNPYRLGGAYVVCESGKDRVVSVDWRGIRRILFSGGLDFCKDADPMNTEGDWLITDTRKNRVLIWNIDSDEPKKEFYLGEHTKPYESDYLTGSDSFV